MTQEITTLQPGQAIAPIVPQTISEMMEFAKLIAVSKLVPKDYQGSPEDVLVAMQKGMELGLTPMASLSTIAVINGRPAMWGDGMLGLVKRHPQHVATEEYLTVEENGGMTATCICKRANEPDVIRTFSEADARTAGLLGKAGPWKQYPKRMLQMRARTFALRDMWADVFAGLTSAEEVVDYSPIEVSTVSTVKPASTAESVKAQMQLDRSVKAFDPAPAEAEAQTIDAEIIEQPPASPVEAEVVEANDGEGMHKDAFERLAWLLDFASDEESYRDVQVEASEAKESMSAEQIKKLAGMMKVKALALNIQCKRGESNG